MASLSRGVHDLRDDGLAWMGAFVNDLDRTGCVYVDLQ